MVRIILIQYLRCKISQSKLVSLRSEMTDLSQSGPLSSPALLASQAACADTVPKHTNILMVTIMAAVVTYQVSMHSGIYQGVRWK